MTEKIGRNDPCPCRSGKKYKKCHLRFDEILQHEDISALRALSQSQPKPEPFLNIVPSVLHKGHRFRAIWNHLYPRPPIETFHEFVLNVLRWTLGEEWYQQQRTLSQEDRHIIMQWLESYETWTKERRPNDIKEGDTLGAYPSGDVQALMTLAYDVFCLQIVNKLPEFLVDRLKDRMGFQGVRYEIAVAAIMARSGFDITFLDDVVKSQKHCDFIARDRDLGVKIGVEAKSRHRRGVLHRPGQLSYDPGVQGEFRGLFQKACEQKPADLPFFVFLDVNLPTTPSTNPGEKPWCKDIRDMVSANGPPTPESPDPYNTVVLTNFSFYYTGRETAPGGEYGMVVTPQPQTQLPATASILERIEKTLKRYNYIPREI